MGINKVQYGNTTLIDLTADTVTADKLMQGYTAHDRSGAIITGTATGGSGDGYVWQDENGYVHLSDEQGTSVTVEALSVTQNGTYTAPTGKAYSPVSVNVSGGGGSSSYKLICSEEYEASTTSTSTTVIGTMSGTYENPYKSILYIQVRDKAGKRNGYFLGYNCYWQQPVAGSQLNNYRMTNVLITNTSGAVVASSTSQYGVFPATPQFSNGTFSVNISTRYNSSYSGTIDGTYVVDIYSLQYPDNISPYE